MADARLAKTRSTLPIGYQFGDGRLPRSLECYVAERTMNTRNAEYVAYCRKMFKEAVDWSQLQEWERH